VQNICLRTFKCFKKNSIEITKICELFYM